MDLEVSALEPIVFWNPRKKPFYVYFSFLIELIFYPFIGIINFLKRHVSIFVRNDFFTRHYRWHDLIAFLLPLWMYFASGTTFWHAVSTWLWIVITTSFIIYTIGTNSAHHHPDIFKDGDQLNFPQLKYPSLRDESLRDPVQWLAGKAMDDGAEGLWRIHDKLYDLTRFIKRHPGGEEWLELTQGTDITEAFESHHLNPSTEKILTQYYIRDAKTPRNSPFTFKEDGFYKTLKRAAFEQLKKIPKDASKTADNITDGLFLSLLVSSALACWVTNAYAANFWYAYASVNLAFLTVACHNFIHRKTNWRMYLFNMSMWSYRDFRVSHVLSHHLYTNTLMDLEISSLEPFLFYNPRKDKPLHAKLGFITEIFFFPFVFLISFAKRFLSIFVRQGFFKSHYRWHDAIGLLLPVWMGLASGAPILQVISTWLWINCTGSLIFYSIGVNAAHHHPDAIKDGDQPASETPDWGMHQVEALLDRKDINGNAFAVMTLFGDHALHHMLPTLDHSLLKYMHPIFIDLCEKFQAKYRVSTQFKMVLGQIKETMRTEFKTKK